MQGQRTGALVEIFASPNNIYETVFSGRAGGPDEVVALRRPLRAGETVFATQALPGEAAGSFAPTETVQPEPDPAELGPIMADSHLHWYASCAAFGNGLPGARVSIDVAGPVRLGEATVDAASGRARVGFAEPLQGDMEATAVQALCGRSGPVLALPSPDLPYTVPDATGGLRLRPPVIQGPLHDCERAVRVEGVSEGALVRLYRDGEHRATACFDSSGLWYRIEQPLKQGERIHVDQYFPGRELSSPPSATLPVLPASAVPAPVLVGPACKGSTAVRLSGLRYGATVRVVQAGKNRLFQHASPVAEVEAWDATCDIPLIEPLDPVRGTHLLAIQSLCGHDSPVSAALKIHRLTQVLPPPKLQAPLYECGRAVRVSGVHRGARLEVEMSCAAAPGWRLLAAQLVYSTSADIGVAPALRAGQQVRVRQVGCGQTALSAVENVAALPDLPGPRVQDCGDHLHLTQVVPGARVEVYVNAHFFKDVRSGASEAFIDLDAPLPDGVKLTARQLMCGRVSGFGPELVVRSDVVKRQVEWVRTERVCHWSGPGSSSDSAAAGILGTDLGIVLDHDSGDGGLYLFLGDTHIDEDVVDDFPENGDAIAFLARVPQGGPPFLRYVHDIDDGEPRPRVFGIHNVRQQEFEVPTGAFSHAGKMYVFASTDHFTDEPKTAGLGKDPHFMGRSVLASSADVRTLFQVVPGHGDISNASRDAQGEFKFINIAAAKIDNDRWLPNLPANAEPGGQGLILMGSGRYRESQPVLAYVPLPPGKDPAFDSWRYLAGRGHRVPGAGPCGVPFWVQDQARAVPLWDDSAHALGNKGVVGELSLAYVEALGLWIALYGGVVARTAEQPWGPWSEPVPLFDRARDHDGLDEGARFIHPDGGTYGPYIIPRFTEYDPLTRRVVVYYVMSTWNPYQIVLMRSELAPRCEYEPRLRCPGPG
ncbi:DUF4185 domain-containing protein [Eleftheria terrae]|uniref:DUF4185 domain-containing protein n=1 Tax=Eleftheria terrae TaxID=1597781 RepID=UPI00263A4F2C|nr:DUF4185 domain-containing protein [Eleftheria terrae]WKB55801.1 DUF4185 domain-containing protein [Eleftheria terrae]